jgi:hypothetical protein
MHAAAARMGSIAAADGAAAAQALRSPSAAADAAAAAELAVVLRQPRAFFAALDDLQALRSMRAPSARSQPFAAVATQAPTLTVGGLQRALSCHEEAAREAAAAARGGPGVGPHAAGGTVGVAAAEDPHATELPAVPAPAAAAGDTTAATAAAARRLLRRLRSVPAALARADADAAARLSPADAEAAALEALVRADKATAAAGAVARGGRAGAQARERELRRHWGELWRRQRQSRHARAPSAPEFGGRAREAAPAPANAAAVTEESESEAGTEGDDADAEGLPWYWVDKASSAHAHGHRARSRAARPPAPSPDTTEHEPEAVDPVVAAAECAAAERERLRELAACAARHQRRMRLCARARGDRELELVLLAAERGAAVRKAHGAAAAAAADEDAGAGAEPCGTCGDAGAVAGEEDEAPTEVLEDVLRSSDGSAGADADVGGEPTLERARPPQTESPAPAFGTAPPGAPGAGTRRVLVPADGAQRQRQEAPCHKDTDGGRAMAALRSADASASDSAGDGTRPPSARAAATPKQPEKQQEKSEAGAQTEKPSQKQPSAARNSGSGSDADGSAGGLRRRLPGVPPAELRRRDPLRGQPAVLRQELNSAYRHLRSVPPGAVRDCCATLSARLPDPRALPAAFTQQLESARERLRPPRRARQVRSLPLSALVRSDVFSEAVNAAARWGCADDEEDARRGRPRTPTRAETHYSLARGRKHPRPRDPRVAGGPAAAERFAAEVARMRRALKRVPAPRERPLQLRSFLTSLAVNRQGPGDIRGVPVTFRHALADARARLQHVALPEEAAASPGVAGGVLDWVKGLFMKQRTATAAHRKLLPERHAHVR